MKVSKFNNHFENNYMEEVTPGDTPASEIYNPVSGAITNEDFSLKSFCF